MISCKFQRVVQSQIECVFHIHVVLITLAYFFVIECYPCCLGEGVILISNCITIVSFTMLNKVDEKEMTK